MTETLSAENRARLAHISTATLSTALLKRGLRNMFIQDVRPVGSQKGNMVGEAYTLRYIPSREDIDTVEVFKDPAHPQRKAVEECPPGHVLVIDSRKDARAASSGDILITRLMKRGCAGIVTDGGFRDSPTIAELPFAAYHNRPSAPTNLTRHHAIDINVPIGCGDVPVYPGDIVVGDDEGVIIIPAHLANDITQEAFEMTVFEDFVAEEVMNGETIIGLYPPTKEEAQVKFKAWRQANNR